MSSKTRNGYIDLLRFVAACIIMYFHFGKAPFLRLDGTWGSFPSGALFVEFFFMLSGYFAISSFHASGSSLNIGKFMLKKYVHFLPYTILATILGYTKVFLLSDLSFKQILSRSFMAPFDALLWSNTGANLVGYMGVFWYLSAMLITMPLILYAARKFPSFFREYMVWVVPLFLYGIIIRNLGTLRTADWIFGNLRAIAGMLLGCGIYYAVQALPKRAFSASQKTLLTILELLFLGVAIAFCTVASFSKTYLDIFCVLMLFLTTAITLSGKSWTCRIHGKFFTFLGKLSLPLYCVHYPIINLYKECLPDSSIGFRMVVTTLTALGVAYAVLLIVEHWILPAQKRLSARWKALYESPM